LNWDAIGAIAEVLSAVGVIASLAYLAVQIRQNTQQIRQNIEASRTTSFHQAQQHTWQLGLEMAKNPVLSRLVARHAHEGLDAFTPEERMQFEGAASSFYFGMDSLFQLYEKGRVDEESWDNTFENLLPWLANPHLRVFLHSRPGPISRRFIAYVEARLVERERASKTDGIAQ